MKATLFVLGGRDVGESFELDGRATVGRDRSCEIQLRDRSISRRHAEFRFEGLDWVVEDLGSRNGLHAGGRRVERAVLSDQDEILLGEVPLRIRFEGAESSSVAPTPDGEIEIEDEILLDVEPVAPPSPAVTREAARVDAADPVDVGPPPAPPSTLSSSDRRRAEILSEGKRAGLLRGDLAQQPVWVRATIAIVVLAAAGGIVAGMFRLVLSMRGTL